MLISIPAFAVVILGVVLYCWFLSAQQRRLTRAVEMLERLGEQTVSVHTSKERAA
jgi:CcmD family protein